METTFSGKYKIDDEYSRIDFDRVQKWLSSAYWSVGIGKEEIERGARNSSIVVGAYLTQEQVAFLRVVSDKTRFAYFLDVFVDEKHRGWGLAKSMIKYVFEHPDFKDVYLWLLATRDAHPIYAELGFKALDNPQNWMAISKGRANS
ncbi:MAG: GNAT family N-acetyltransferase [Dehalococcoidia bacterium]